MWHYRSPVLTAPGRQPESGIQTMELIVGYCAADARRQNSQQQSAERETAYWDWCQCKY